MAQPQYPAPRFDRVSHPLVGNTLASLKRQAYEFGIPYGGQFNSLGSVELHEGVLKYDNGHGLQSVSSQICRITGLQSARWLDHLAFRRADRAQVMFKPFVSRLCNLHFS